jgi:hypothetical protein
MKVEGLENVAGVETFRDHTCARSMSLAYFACWGSNVDGEQGDYVVHKLGPEAAGQAYSARPARVALQLPALDIGMGPDATYAKTADGAVWAWGKNTRGLLGVDSQEDIIPLPSPVVVQGPTGLQALLGVDGMVRSGGLGQCAGMYDQQWYDSSYLCWGENDHGELGLNETAAPETRLPSAVRAVPLVSRQLVRGEDHACAIGTEGDRDEIWCYGAAHLVGSGQTLNDGGAVTPQWRGAPLRWNPEPILPILE